VTKFSFNLPSLPSFAFILTLLLLALPIHAGAQTAHFSYAPVPLGSGLNMPNGVALDGSGNAFIADTYNNAVKEILAAGGYTTVKTLVSGYYYPQSIAVDGNGNLFIADYLNTQALKLQMSAVNFGTVAIGQTSATIPLTFTFDGDGTIGSPVALTHGAVGLGFAVANTGTCKAGTSYSAGSTCTVDVTFTPKLAGTRYGAAALVDGSGNVLTTEYMMASGSGPQVNFPPGSQLTLPISGLSYPHGVAVDESGSIYIADDFNNRVLKETPSGGGYTQSTIGSGLYYPLGVAVDGSGNAHISDEGNSRVLEEDFADPPSLSFAAASVGSTSSDSPQTVTVENVGDAALIFPIPNTGNNPSIATGFTLNSSGASVCPLVSANSSTAGTLAAGACCLLPNQLFTCDGGHSQWLAGIDGQCDTEDFFKRHRYLGVANDCELDSEFGDCRWSVFHTGDQRHELLLGCNGQLGRYGAHHDVRKFEPTYRSRPSEPGCYGRHRKRYGDR